MRQVRTFLKNIRQSKSGNAAVLVTVGLPMLLGAAGLAVDLSQWYLWKNEIQYAADQAAIAGAWARTASGTQADYVTRARQEFTANLSMTTNFVDVPAVALASYAGNSNSAVTVSATATKTLPFTGMLINRGVTVKVSSEASFSQGQSYTSCIVATDPNGSGAVTISGNTVLTASCGIAALSTSESSVIVNGNPTVNAGWVLSAGGIDDWFNLHTNDQIHENMSGLYDPFLSYTPPTNTTARTYSCAGGTTSTSGTITTGIAVAYAYYEGSNEHNAHAYSYSSPKAGTNSSTTQNGQTIANGTSEGSSTRSSTSTWTALSGNGNNTIWEVKTTTTTQTYTNVTATTAGAAGSMLPGTYTGGFHVSCTTTMSSGVYVINGGGVDIDGQYQVTGNGIIIVLKNGAYIKINGGSNVNLTAANSTQLQAAGVSATSANQLAGMLVFEDRSSSGSNKTNINGNTSTTLNGYLYFPVSTVNFAGTATVTSQCLMLVARKIIMAGTLNFSTFCPAGMSETTNVSSAASIVKLVS